MNPLLEMRSIEKSFFGVRLLRGVNLDLMHGEVHVFLGANGAGKPTLIKIPGGAYTLDSGEIILGGERIDMSRHSPQASAVVGIIVDTGMLAKWDEQLATHGLRDLSCNRPAFLTPPKRSCPRSTASRCTKS